MTEARELRVLRWIPSPRELLGAALRLGNDRPGVWVHALTPALFVLAWGVAFLEKLDPSGHVLALPYPLAAITVCCAALPIARATRRSLDVRSAHALYRGLLWLAPWVALAWPLSAHTDADGDAGGARAAAVLLAASCPMCAVLPVMIELARRVWRRPIATFAVSVSAVGLSALMIAATWQTLAHSTRDGLTLYAHRVAEFVPTATPDTFTVRTSMEGIVQHRDGARCTTGFWHGPTVSHPCAAVVHLYEMPRDLSTRRSWLRERPRYREMVFIRVGGTLINNKHPARFMLFVAPPWEWIAGASVGLALALWTWARTRRALRAWRSLTVREGVARDGSVHCADGVTARLPDALADVRGAVLVLGDRALAATPFRDAAAGDYVVVPGDRADFERALVDCEAVATSFALAVLWLPAAPLVAAPWLGMFAPLP